MVHRLRLLLPALVVALLVAAVAFVATAAGVFTSNGSDPRQPVAVTPAGVSPQEECKSLPSGDVVKYIDGSTREAVPIERRDACLQMAELGAPIEVQQKAGLRPLYHMENGSLKVEWFESKRITVENSDGTKASLLTNASNTPLAPADAQARLDAAAKALGVASHG